MNKFFADRLKEIILACKIHRERLFFAYDKLKNKFPLTLDSYNELTAEEISYSDQLIFRFTKLQDTIGHKLFPLILEGLKEDTENKPFIDILNRLEKLNILEDHSQWLILRETRNQVTHEYPFNLDDIIEGLNELENQVEILDNIWKQLKTYCEERFL